MQQHRILGVVVGVLALGPVAATAQAGAPVQKATHVRAKTSLVTGKTVSFRSGKLRVAVGGKRVDYVVTTDTNCSFSRGNKGTGMRCGNLSRRQYLAKPVRVLWYTDTKRRRVADLVAVILSPRR